MFQAVLRESPQRQVRLEFNREMINAIEKLVSTPQRFDWNCECIRRTNSVKFQPRNGSIGILSYAGYYDCEGGFNPATVRLE